jgi:uncharacterized membrane protein YkoI
MGLLFILLLIFGALVFCKLKQSVRQARCCVKAPLTAREQAMYFQLVRALGDDYIVLSQVAFSQILTTTGGSAEQNKKLWLQMRQKVADYIICRRDFSIVAEIELDDSTHDSKQEQDAIRDRHLRQAGIKVIRWRQIPSVEDILKAIVPPKPAPKPLDAVRQEVKTS